MTLDFDHFYMEVTTLLMDVEPQDISKLLDLPPNKQKDFVKTREQEIAKVAMEKRVREEKEKEEIQ
jgi:hypothetical protein